MIMPVSATAREDIKFMENTNLANHEQQGMLPHMSTLTIDLPESLDAKLTEQVMISGAKSKSEYLLGLVESDCAEAALESLLTTRINGPFAPLETDWKERVRITAARK